MRKKILTWVIFCIPVLFGGVPALSMGDEVITQRREYPRDAEVVLGQVLSGNITAYEQLIKWVQNAPQLRDGVVPFLTALVNLTDIQISSKKFVEMNGLSPNDPFHHDFTIAVKLSSGEYLINLNSLKLTAIIALMDLRTKKARDALRVIAKKGTGLAQLWAAKILD